MSAAVGPVATNLRPSFPNDFQDTSDPGPPDRRLLVGWWMPGGVVLFSTEKAWLIRATKPFRSRPLITRYVSAAAAIQAVARAPRGPTHRDSNFASHR